MIVNKYINDQVTVYDDVFSIEKIRELEVENSSLLFSFGAYDNKENPVPTGLACEGITHTETFKLLWKFCEEHCPELNGLALFKSSCNIFAPSENAYYHIDDSDPKAMTLLLYPQTFWDINEGGETKILIDPKKIIHSIAPIPGRIMTFPGTMSHTATGLRGRQRFTPTLKFVSQEVMNKRRDEWLKTPLKYPGNGIEGRTPNDKIKIVKCKKQEPKNRLEQMASLTHDPIAHC